MPDYEFIGGKEPRIYTALGFIGDIQLHFRGEQYRGLPITDTAVTINGEPLCSITWDEKENFIRELNDVINKYRI